MLGQSLANLKIPQDIIITSAVIGVVVAVLAALYPSLQAGRVSPLEALRVRALTRQGCLIRWGWLVGLVLFISSAAVLIINPFPNDPQFRMGMIAVIFLFIGGTLLIPITVDIWEVLLRPIVQLLFGHSGSLGSSNVKRARQRTSLTVAALMIGVAIIIVWAMTISFKADLDAWLKGFIGGDL